MDRKDSVWNVPRALFVCGKEGSNMPKTRFQRMVFALLTVLVTVHAYVFYSLYVVNGPTLTALYRTGSVLEAIRPQGGDMMCGALLPIWAVVVVEFCFAFMLEVIMGSPCAFRLAAACFDPETTHPVLFETAVISATVGLMCPTMSFIAAWLYYPYYEGFSPVSLLAGWLRLVCFNFPFAWFTQVFFIQPLVRTVFRRLPDRWLGRGANAHANH